MIGKNERQIIKKILKFCNFTYQTIHEPQKGYRNTSYPVELLSGDWINIILYKNEKGIASRVEQADSLSDHLCNAGFPTRKSLGQIIKLDDGNVTRYTRCYTYLPGKTIPWEAYTMKHIKLLGETMATLHHMSSSITLKSQVINESAALSERMRDYFQQPGVIRALDDKLHLGIATNALQEFDKTLRDPRLVALPQQALHMDFVRGNILFNTRAAHDAPEISGIIDFEKASNGPVLFDIARTLAFLLVDCKFKDPHKVYKYFIQSGYIKRGGASLDIQQLQLLSKLTRFYLMYDLYKFLRHNPYESLLMNEHFLRTRDFLLQDGTIKYISGKEHVQPETVYVTNLEGTR